MNNKNEVVTRDFCNWLNGYLDGKLILTNTEITKIEKKLQQIIIATNFDHLIRHSNFLILSSTDLLANFNIDLVNDIFVITTENVNIKYLLTKLNDKLFGNKIKYFIQNLDSTWKVGYDSLIG